ncbi:hypothetical protein HJC23_002214 [Cyclotella cryptica]|uniref:Uncharacterized protein n=1 Tax=Cyclotella cryptica TaxID=29204 RepID=A0ABD3Q712_9STRA
MEKRERRRRMRGGLFELFDSIVEKAPQNDPRKYQVELRLTGRALRHSMSLRVSTLKGFMKAQKYAINWNKP